MLHFLAKPDAADIAVFVDVDVEQIAVAENDESAAETVADVETAQDSLGVNVMIESSTFLVDPLKVLYLQPVEY